MALLALQYTEWQHGLAGCLICVWEENVKLHVMSKARAWRSPEKALAKTALQVPRLRAEEEY